MNNQILSFLYAAFCLVILSACASEKMTYERGWVGGKYLESNTSLIEKLTGNYFKEESGTIPILPNKIIERQSGAVFVSRVFADTPVMRAGIREGDLIIAVDNNPVEDLDTFHGIVDKSKAGEKIAVSVYRDGEIVELPVIVGKETYQKWGYFTAGFRLGTELDPIPTPNFNILHLISYQTTDTRLQLHSPEYTYYRDALMLSADQTDRNPESYTDNEGWDAWFVIFGLSGKKIIMSQEI